MTRKTGYYVDADGRKVEYVYWQASREVLPADLPAGVSRKRITGSGTTQAEAQERLEDNYRRFIRGDSQEGSTGRSRAAVTVATLLDEWFQHNDARAVSPQQARAYRGYGKNHIVPALGDIRLTSLTETDLTRFIHETLPAKTAPDGSPLLGDSARRNVYIALSGALSYAVRHGYLTASPLAAVKAPRKGKPDDDIDAFLNDANAIADIILNNHPDETRWLLAMLGLRKGERLGMAWKQVRSLQDDDTATLVVAQQLTRIPNVGLAIKPATKTGKPRTIRLVDPWLASIRRYREQWNDLPSNPLWTPPDPVFADLLFLKPTGRPIDPNDDADDWRRLLKQAGVPHWRQHLMRHYTAYLLASTPGVTLADVMSILGHDTTAMSAYYAHLDTGRKTTTLTAFSETLKKQTRKKSEN